MGEGTATAILSPTPYQGIVIWDPTEKQYEEGDRSKIIVEPKIVLAKDEGGAFLLFGREIPEEYTDQVDQCRVVVRPF